MGKEYHDRSVYVEMGERNIYRSFIKPLLITLLLSLTAIFEGEAQQLPIYSQYTMNKYLVNPALAGHHGYTEFNLAAREQWIGMKDSPKTHAFSFHTRVLPDSYINRILYIRRKKVQPSRISKVGLGGYIFNDRTGLVSRTGLRFTYAYHININEGQLSFGLSGNLYQFKLDREEFRSYEPDDILLSYTNYTAIIPDADAGVYYSDENFYGGLAVAYLLQSKYKFGNHGFENYRLKRHYYIIGGYNYKRIEDYTVEPNILIKVSESPRFQMDLGVRINSSDRYWGGLAYRTGGAIIFLGGVRVDKLYFGYSFDLNLINIKHSFGSHEFMLAVKFGDSARRYRWVKE